MLPVVSYSSLLAAAVENHPTHLSSHRRVPGTVVISHRRRRRDGLKPKPVVKLTHHIDGKISN